MSRELRSFCLFMPLLILAGIISVAPSALAEIKYTVTDLGYSIAYDINNEGVVVGRDDVNGGALYGIALTDGSQ